jgi:LPXTG-motif cell wall-anchored protein
VENNQCTPCDAGETADGAGNCTTVEDVILTPTPGGTQVEGVTQTRTPQVAAAELPRTGKATLPLVELGLGLVLLGLGALLAARDEAESA